jgi:ZIP family zinc transporter
LSLLLTVILAASLAGFSMPLGALLAHFERIKTKWIEDELIHGVTAFGGGALLSAVALVLVPQGISNLHPFVASFAFIFGGLCFMLLDVQLKKIETPASQLAAMLGDFIPESIALGAAFATSPSTGILLAVMIALQNLPEGFSAYCELRAIRKYSAVRLISIFSVMSLLGPIAGVIGFLWLNNSPIVISTIMLFASGGILYSIFQDIAPQAKLDNHWAPPMGAVLGFVIGMIGYMVI